MGRRTIMTVRDGSGNPREGPNESRDPQGCPGRVWGPSSRWKELAGPPEGPGRVGRPNKRVGGVGRPSCREGRVGRPSR